MLFKQVLVDAILEGRKTQTRRPVNYQNPRSPYWYEHCKYQPGVGFKIQGGLGGEAYAVVTALRQEEFGAISEADAVAEGFVAGENHHGMFPSARQAFWAYVEGLYGDFVKRTDLFWVIEFVLEDGQ